MKKSVTKECGTALFCLSKASKAVIHGNEVEWGLSGPKGRGKWALFDENRVSVFQDEKF